MTLYCIKHCVSVAMKPNIESARACKMINNEFILNGQSSLTCNIPLIISQKITLSVNL